MDKRLLRLVRKSTSHTTTTLSPRGTKQLARSEVRRRMTKGPRMVSRPAARDPSRERDCATVPATAEVSHRSVPGSSAGCAESDP